MQVTTVGSVNGTRQAKALVMALVIFGVVWELAVWIVAGSATSLIYFGLSVVVIAMVLYILKDWQTGVLLFLTWLLFEDLIRKYLGNNMAVYFGKDFLVGVAYISFYFARRKRRVEPFNVPFLVPLLVFFGFGAMQMFNPFSTSILYGLLGMKLYFYYVPLMWLGYAMVDHPKNLDRLLLVSMVLGIVISALGIAQSVLGLNFLNPEDMGGDIYELSHLTRYSPITHEAVLSTSSVFVSSGRFSGYLVLLWILAMGMVGYLLLARRPSAKYAVIGIGIVTAAVMISGNRTPFVFVIGSAFVMTAAFLWGAPWQWGQGHRMVTALRRASLFGGIGLILMLEVFPSTIGGNWAFFSETLSIGGEGSQLSDRAWDYPILNLEQAFYDGLWPYGHGIGTCSLGIQYITKFIDNPVPQVGVESGFGAIIVELGIVGLALWFVLVYAVLASGFRVVKRLRQTIYFPISFAIWWYAVVMLILLMYLGFQSYQNFVNNAYLWLLVGVLYRLPKLAEMPQPVPAPNNIRYLSDSQFRVTER